MTWRCQHSQDPNPNNFQGTFNSSSRFPGAVVPARGTQKACMIYWWYCAILLSSRDRPTHPATCCTYFDKETYPDWIYRWTAESTLKLRRPKGTPILACLAWLMEMCRNLYNHLNYVFHMKHSQSFKKRLRLWYTH